MSLGDVDGVTDDPMAMTIEARQHDVQRLLTCGRGAVVDLWSFVTQGVLMSQFAVTVKSYRQIRLLQLKPSRAI